MDAEWHGKALTIYCLFCLLTLRRTTINILVSSVRYVKCIKWPSTVSVFKISEKSTIWFLAGLSLPNSSNSLHSKNNSEFSPFTYTNAQTISIKINYVFYKAAGPIISCIKLSVHCKGFSLVVHYATKNGTWFFGGCSRV